MTVTVNGQTAALDEGATILAMLTQRGYVPERVVVEHNRAIVDRSHWSEKVISSGDEIEVIAFLGGG